MEVSELRSIVRCDFDTGRLYWLSRPRGHFKSKKAHGIWEARYAGNEALIATNVHGYKCGRIGGRDYIAHRVIWALHTGEWPATIDHINQNRLDNRLENLRAATVSQNNMNRTKQRNNSSGVTGVEGRPGSWRARISVKGEKIHLGTFKTIAAAAMARELAKAQYGFAKAHGL